jgi:ribose transport system ATP-binding protein
MSDNNKSLLFAKGICKQFNGIEVLKNVGLEIRSGEVHALMGENGAGKSTIIKIITGVYTKDGGEIYINGEPVEITSRQDARKNGISVIYQELSLIPALTVAENIFLGQELTWKGVLNKKKMNAAVRELIDRYGFDLKPTTPVESLGMAKRQMVEILKALYGSARLIIMDEPTASLSASETEKLFGTIEGLKKKGTAILYISHRLEEVFRIADRLTVMRDGENVGVLEKGAINAPTVTKMMIGREIRRISDRGEPVLHADMCLEVKDLSYRKLLRDVSFKAFGGEVLGIGGLVGSGRTELIKCIYGDLKPGSGSVTLNGKSISKSVGRNIKNGFGLVPEDRRREGFVPVLSVEKNITAASYDMLATAGFVARRREVAHAEKAIKDYDVRPPMRRLPVSNLSGGNQQKVVLGRWLSRASKVLLLDEPTAGVDVGVKEDLYNYVWSLAKSGAVVIMVSSDLEELTYVADRILVMHGGRFFEEFTHQNVTQEAILLAASGVHTEEGRPL